MNIPTFAEYLADFPIDVIADLDDFDAHVAIFTLYVEYTDYAYRSSVYAR